MRWPLLALTMLVLAGCAAGPDPLDRRVQTWHDNKFHDVTRQLTDFTCGSAALSTVSEYYYGKPISESEFTTAMRVTYSKEEWKDKEKNGLSMLDMKRAAEHFGFAAEGLKMTLQQLTELNGPVIILLQRGDYLHFVVFRGFVGDRAFVANPILGNLRMPLYRFTDQWTGYALAVWIEGKDLPVKNALAVDPNDRAHERGDVGREALYTSQVHNFIPSFSSY